jgi:Predicted phosphatases
MAELILFDLDGTLLDSKEGITKSVQYALKKLGVVVEDRRELVRFIGPPLQESFENFYRVDGKKGIQFYRECFVGEKKMLENEIYSGIPELLTQLKESGKKLVVATSKPTEYSKIILNHFGLANFFEEIQGSELDLSLVEKEDVIRVVLEKFPDYSKEDIIMIGDRRHDIYGAKVNGLKSIGVLYGYGSREELETAGANQIVETAGELYPLL